MSSGANTQTGRRVHAEFWQKARQRGKTLNAFFLKKKIEFDYHLGEVRMLSYRMLDFAMISTHSCLFTFTLPPFYLCQWHTSAQLVHKTRVSIESLKLYHQRKHFSENETGLSSFRIQVM